MRRGVGVEVSEDMATVYRGIGKDFLGAMLVSLRTWFRRRLLSCKWQSGFH